MAVKRSAYVSLAESALDWVILRPGTLTDSPGTGRVTLGHAIAYGSVPRDDVAHVIAVLLFQPEITEGQRPVSDAVAALVPRRAEL